MIKGKAVLALQHPLDSSVYTMSASTSYQDMYERAEQTLGDSFDQLVVCPHPTCGDSPPKLRPGRARFKSNSISTIEECVDAEMVCAISSGILWEAAGLGCDVHLLGHKYSKAWMMLALNPHAMAVKAMVNHAAAGDPGRMKEIIERIVSRDDHH